jgi:hypothetical protein
VGVWGVGGCGRLGGFGRRRHTALAAGQSSSFSCAVGGTIFTSCADASFEGLTAFEPVEGDGGGDGSAKVFKALFDLGGDFGNFLDTSVSPFALGFDFSALVGGVCVAAVFAATVEPNPPGGSRSAKAFFGVKPLRGDGGSVAVLADILDLSSCGTANVL